MSDDNREVMEAVTELRSAVESKNADTAESKAKIEKINTAMDIMEEANQKVALAANQQKKELEEMTERCNALEISMAQSGNGKKNVNYKEKDEYKALNRFCQIGEGRELPDEQKALLRTDSDVEGGYLVDDPEFDNVILKKITEISNVRQVARVRTVGNKSLEIPVRNNLLIATYEGEADTGDDSTSDYSNETLTAFRQTVTVPITKDMLMDSAFDMESEIMSDAGEAFAQGEGNGFVVGSGFKVPEGFMTNATILADSRVGTAGGALVADDVILLTGDLKVGYNPMYGLNRRTLATLRTLKSTDGVFLWQPGMNGPVANTLNGFSYIILEDMPDIAATNRPIVFADFQRGYTIVDRTGISLIRDELTQKKKAIVEFTINRWNTGKVTLPEAFKTLTITA